MPREWIGAALVVGGAAILGYRPGAFSAHGVGAAAIVFACLCWGFDNNLTERISGYDPIVIVQIKALAAGSSNVILAVVLRQGAVGVVGVHTLLAALVIGFVCYGISIVLDGYALRYLGAAREAVFFATAPFLGAIAAIPILGERVGRIELTSAALMALGIIVFESARSS